MPDIQQEMICLLEILRNVKTKDRLLSRQSVIWKSFRLTGKRQMGNEIRNLNICSRERRRAGKDNEKQQNGKKQEEKQNDTGRMLEHEGLLFISGQRRSKAKDSAPSLKEQRQQRIQDSPELRKNPESELSGKENHQGMGVHSQLSASMMAGSSPSTCSLSSWQVPAFRCPPPPYLRHSAPISA